MADLQQELDRLRRARPLTVLLDYDGTLVPFAESPELAMPDRQLIDLLVTLGRRPHTSLHLVSGRPQVTFDEWFGDLSIALWAEHGLWRRPAGRRHWVAAAPLPAYDVFTLVQPLLAEFTAATPGSRVERKSTSLAWHYRRVESGLAMNRVRALRAELAHAVAGTPFELLEGQKVIEIRPRGINKALVANHVLTGSDAESESTGILAMGDDRTDEDLFRALPQSAVTIAVGSVARGAAYRLSDHRAARAVLRRLLAPS